MTCQKKHRYLPEFEELHEAQDDRNNDRHKCAGCAYEAYRSGYNYGKKVNS